MSRMGAAFAALCEKNRQRSWLHESARSSTAAHAFAQIIGLLLERRFGIHRHAADAREHIIELALQIGARFLRRGAMAAIVDPDVTARDRCSET